MFDLVNCELPENDEKLKFAILEYRKYRELYEKLLTEHFDLKLAIQAERRKDPEYKAAIEKFYGAQVLTQETL